MYTHSTLEKVRHERWTDRFSVFGLIPLSEPNFHEFYPPDKFFGILRFDPIQRRFIYRCAFKI